MKIQESNILAEWKRNKILTTQYLKIHRMSVNKTEYQATANQKTSCNKMNAG